MTSGFYTAASGMLTQQRTLNVLSNNIANQDTPGYRSERLISTTFEQTLMTRVEGDQTTQIGKGSPIRVFSEIASTAQAGIITETASPFDVAINGDGYFNILGAENLYLTRNGSFNVDEEGYLVLDGVGYVQGEGGSIQVGGSGFTVGSDGAVYGTDGRKIDTIRLTMPEPGDQLQKLANGLYLDDGTKAMTKPIGTTFVQNALEGSNVDFNREWSKIIEAQRSFQTCSTILKGIDEINKKAANNIASL